MRCAPLGPPTRPRIFFLWGLRPHAPARIAHPAAARAAHGRVGTTASCSPLDQLAPRGVSPRGDPCKTPVSRAVRLPLPLRERAGVRGPPRASAARWSLKPRSDRRRESAPRQPERLLRGTVSIGTRGYLAGPPRPRPNGGASLASLAAPCSSPRRERTGLPSMAALGRGAPHPGPLPQGERGPEPACLVHEARCAPFRRRFAKVSRGRVRAVTGPGRTPEARSRCPDEAWASLKPVGGRGGRRRSGSSGRGRCGGS